MFSYYRSGLTGDVGDGDATVSCSVQVDGVSADAANRNEPEVREQIESVGPPLQVAPRVDDDSSALSAFDLHIETVGTCWEYLEVCYGLKFRHARRTLTLCRVIGWNDYKWSISVIHLRYVLIRRVNELLPSRSVRDGRRAMPYVEID